MQIKQSIAPYTEADEQFVEFYNNSSITVHHGMAIVRDTTATAGNYGKTTTTLNDPDLMGIVFDPYGNGVASGAVGVIRTKGFSPLRVYSTCTSLTASTNLRIACGAVSGLCDIATSSDSFSAVLTTYGPFSIIGKAYGNYVSGTETTTSVWTINAYVNIPRS